METTNMSMISSLSEKLSQLYEMGGPVVAILVGFSIIALALIFYKITQLYFLGAWSRGRATKAVKRWVEGDKEAAYATVANHKACVSKIISAAMRGQRSFGSENKLVREDIENQATQTISRASSGLKLLELIAQISPLLGLFGTVIGMIDAFQAMQSAGSNIDPSVLAGGIWVALLTTAVGLGVAIPASMILSWLEATVDKTAEDIETLVTSVLTEDLTSQSTLTRVGNQNIVSMGLQHAG